MLAHEHTQLSKLAESTRTRVSCFCDCTAGRPCLTC